MLGIVEALEKSSISSPSGREKWPKRTVDVLLSNEKYMGDVRLKGPNPDEDYYLPNNHERIISREQFQSVQEEKARRSNVVQQGDELKRAVKRYSEGRYLAKKKVNEVGDIWI